MNIPEIKLLVIGSANVGKTSLILQWCDGEFCKEAARPTLGVDLKSKLVTVNNQQYKVTVWDTAGSEKFRAVTSAYYRNAHGVIIAYDVCAASSLDSLEYWINESSKSAKPVRFVVGNKIDKLGQRQVDGQGAYDYLNVLGEIGQGMLVDSYYEVSAMENNAVCEMFDQLVAKIVQTPGLVQSPTLPSSSSPSLSAQLKIKSRPCVSC